MRRRFFPPRSEPPPPAAVVAAPAPPPPVLRDRLADLDVLPDRVSPDPQAAAELVPSKAVNLHGDKQSTASGATELSQRLRQAGGSKLDAFNNQILGDVVQALPLSFTDAKTYGEQIIAAIRGVIGIAPKDELEGMMAAQMIASHSAAMECYRRAMLGEQTLEGRNENLSQANKLSRTFTLLFDALNRHRGKGQQKVTVEHVDVHQGGQAIVGPVTSGGGDRGKSEEQPHAKQIAYAPGSPVWGADAVRESVPIPRDAERPLPNARRIIAGSAEEK
jgi:hypothetical protein